MPIPKPREGEKKDDFIGRCVSAISDEYDQDQALAICYTAWKDKDKKSMSEHDRLLNAIKSREGHNEHNYGILTADRYVKTVQQCIGSDECYKFASTKTVSFQDVVEKAGRTLTYNNPEMVLETNYGTDYKLTDRDGDEVELPKNALMVFKHVLTTPRKDRDGDILRTKGAKPDPKMPLLWQHVHTLPIGKMLQVSEHNSKKLSVISAIIDINELAHDAAVMIDNKMGRFSHGFKAISFSKFKEADGRPTGEEGFDVHEFEIMEESLVSVPANVDAEVEEVMLGLVEGGKLTSGLMKSVGKSIRSNRKRTSFKVNVDLKGENNEETKAGCSGKEGCSCGCAGPSKQADEDQGAKENITEDKEVEIIQERSFDADKAGRVLSSKNVETLKEVKGCLSHVRDKELGVGQKTRGRCDKCVKAVDEMLTSAGVEQDKEEDGYSFHEADYSEMTAKEAMAVIFEKATEAERNKLLEVLNSFKQVEAKQQATEQFLSLL